MELEIKTKLCYHCNQTKLESEFYYYRPKKCKTCCSSVINHKPIDPEAKKANNKKYYLKHKSSSICWQIISLGTILFSVALQLL